MSIVGFSSTMFFCWLSIKLSVEKTWRYHHIKYISLMISQYFLFTQPYNNLSFWLSGLNSHFFENLCTQFEVSCFLKLLISTFEDLYHCIPYVNIASNW